MSEFEAGARRASVAVAASGGNMTARSGVASGSAQQLPQSQLQAKLPDLPMKRLQTLSRMTQPPEVNTVTSSLKRAAVPAAPGSAQAVPREQSVRGMVRSPLELEQLGTPADDVMELTERRAQAKLEVAEMVSQVVDTDARRAAQEQLAALLELEPSMNPTSEAIFDAKLIELHHAVKAIVDAQQAAVMSVMPLASPEAKQAQLTSGRAWRASYFFAMLQLAFIAAGSVYPQISSTYAATLSSWLQLVIFWGASLLALLFFVIGAVSRKRGAVVLAVVVVMLIMLGQLGITIALMVVESTNLSDATYLTAYVLHLAAPAASFVPVVVCMIVVLALWNKAHGLGSARVSPA